MAQTVDWGPGQATLHGGHRCLWTLSSARISCSSSSSTEEICISFQPQHPSIVTATRAVHERTPTWRGGQEPPVGPRVERARESGREEGIGRKGRRERDSERETERHRERKRDTERDRERERKKERENGKERASERERSLFKKEITCSEAAPPVPRAVSSQRPWAISGYSQTLTGRNVRL